MTARAKMLYNPRSSYLYKIYHGRFQAESTWLWCEMHLISHNIICRKEDSGTIPGIPREIPQPAKKKYLPLAALLNLRSLDRIIIPIQNSMFNSPLSNTSAYPV